MTKDPSGAVKFATSKGDVIENKENTTAMNKLVDRGLIKSKGDYIESIPLFLDDTFSALYDQSRSLDETGISSKPGAKKEKGKAGSKLYKMQWLKDKLQYQTDLKKKQRKQGAKVEAPDPKLAEKLKKPSIEDKKDKAQLENQIGELSNDMMFQDIEIKEMREEIERLRGQNAQLRDNYKKAKKERQSNEGLKRKKIILKELMDDAPSMFENKNKNYHGKMIDQVDE